MAGKYTPLEKYLRDLPANQKEVALSFEQIERIINAKLPPSAIEYQQWWENEKEGNHVNAPAWAKAGWKADGTLMSRDFHPVNGCSSKGRRNLGGRDFLPQLAESSIPQSTDVTGRVPA